MGKQGEEMRSLVCLLCLYLSAPLLLTPPSAATTQHHVTPGRLKDLDTAHPFPSRKLHPTRDVGMSQSAASEAERQAMATVSRSLLKLSKKHGRGPHPKVLHSSHDGFPLRPMAGASGTPSTTPISTQGGPVMSSPIKVYLLWSGTVTSTQQAYIRTFVNALGQPSHTAGTAGGLWAVNTLYYGPTKGNYVSSSIVVGAETSTGTASTTTYGSSRLLSTANVFNLVKNAVNKRALPQDPNGIYLVITGPDVSQRECVAGFYLFNNLISCFRWSGQCDQYCGWHLYDQSMKLKYGWAGIPSSGCTGCYESGTPPSVPPGIDNPTASAVSIVTHELEESATDPQGNAWVDNTGKNADRCAWYYGPYIPQFNILVDVNNGGPQWQYLIQYNWDPVRQTCALSA